MAGLTTKKGKYEINVPQARDMQLQHLMRALIALAQSVEDPEIAAWGQVHNGTEQVLVDTDLDGRRYLVIKMPLVERKALPLSPREWEIVRMVAQGHPNKVIAVVLNISAWTVCTHLRRIFAKLGVSSRAAMVARLVEFGSVNDAIVNPNDLPRTPGRVTRDTDGAAAMHRGWISPSASGRAPRVSAPAPGAISRKKAS